MNSRSTHWKFETLGNAIVQFLHGDRPVLITDPWLVGTAYYGSWGIEQPLDQRQLENALRSPYVWISHGHPDHLHIESLQLFDKKSCKILLPDHYSPEIKDSLLAEGFDVQVLRFKEWVPLEDGFRVMCLQNENMDAILAIEAGDVLVLNKNDSPFCGEDRFFRKLLRGYKQTFLLALCAVDADMLNVYDSEMRSLIGTPDERKPGAIWAMSRICDYLGVDHFCCSSSQHIYLRSDSIWANPYRIGWKDMEQYWCARSTKLIQPYVTVDLEDRSVVTNALGAEPEVRNADMENGGDDWSEPMTAEDWTKLETFIRQFHILKRHLDFVGFTVAGVTRRFPLSSNAATRPVDRQRGITFHVPRKSLTATATYGYFDDLLIGNFMKSQIHNTTLYPHFSPIIAKLGGNAKVFTPADLRRFHWYFFKLSPRAFIAMRWQGFVNFSFIPFVRRVAQSLGLFTQAKALYRWRVGSPKILSDKTER